MNAQLPVTRDLRLAYLASIAVAIIMTIASVISLLDWRSIYPGTDPKLLSLFLGQDLLNVVVGLPVLVGGMWLVRRGSLIGLLLWPGGLFYVLYDYAYYALGAPFNALFIPYLVLMTASAYATIAIVASIDGTAVRQRLLSTVRPRLTGGYLVGLALLFTALWTAMSLSALASGTQLDLVPRVVTTLDLTVQLPALLVGGVLLWRRESLGYVVAFGLLLQASTYLVGLSAISVLQETLIGAPIDPVAVYPGIVVGALCLALMASFVRGAAVPLAPRSRRTIQSAPVIP